MGECGGAEGDVGCWEGAGRDAGWVHRGRVLDEEDGGRFGGAGGNAGWVAVQGKTGGWRLNRGYRESLGEQRGCRVTRGCTEDTGWMGVQGAAGQKSDVGWDAGGEVGWVRGAGGHLGVQWRMQRVTWAG